MGEFIQLQTRKSCVNGVVLYFALVFLIDSIAHLGWRAWSLWFCESSSLVACAELTNGDIRPGWHHNFQDVLSFIELAIVYRTRAKYCMKFTVVHLDGG
jgi:hypothetical protein